MVRTLQETLPTSSVARLLDPGAAERATRAVYSNLRASGNASELAVSGDSFRELPQRPIKREISLTADADAALERLLFVFRRATGARLNVSHMVRATLMAMQHAAPEIERAAQSIGPTALPSNAPAYQDVRQRFEDRIVQAIAAGMRAAGPLNAY